MTEEIEILGAEALKDLRKRALAGADISDEEVSAVLATLRNDRHKINTSFSSRKPANGRARQPIDLKGLFDKGKK